MPHNEEILPQTAMYVILGFVGMALVDVIFAGALGMSDAVIVVATFLLLVGYFFLYSVHNYLYE